MNLLAADTCGDEGRKCIIGCREAKKRLLTVYKAQLPTSAKPVLMEIQSNMNKAQKGEEICRDYFAKIVTDLGGQAGSLNAAASKSAQVSDLTRSGADGGAEAAPSKFDQLGGSGALPKDGSGGSGMSPWLVGGIGAAVGGIAGYMFGKNKGEDQGYEEGKKDAEEAAAKKEKNNTHPPHTRKTHIRKQHEEGKKQNSQ
jgi:hypothetical protein